MASSYVPGLTPTFRTPAASSYVPGLTPSLQTPAAGNSGLSPEALQKLQAEMAAWDPKKMVAPGNFTGQPSASQQRVNAYIAEQAKQGNELIYKPAGMNPWENAIGMGDTTNYDEFDPSNPSPNMLPVFRFTTGTKSLGSSSPSGNAPTVLKPGETYTLTDYDGKTLATANTPEQMKALLALSEERGSSGWKLFSDKGTYSQPGTDPTDPRNAVHSRSPADNTAAYITGAGLAAMGGAAALGIGAGGGAGGLGSITGASAANAVLPGLAGSVAPVAGGVGGAAITGAGGLAGLGAVAPNVITVLAPTAGGLSAGTLGGIGAGALGAGTLASGGAGSGATSSGAASGSGQGITVTANKLVPTVADKLAALTPGLGPGLAQALAQPPTSPPATANSGTFDPAANEIVVKANVPPGPYVKPPIVMAGLPAVSAITPPAVNPPTVDVPKVPTEVNSGLSTMDKIRLGLLGAGLISDVAEGGGGAAGRIPGGLGGGLAPVFNAPLPKANLPVATPRTASDMGNIDYYRYGYGPEQSFYTNVPKGEPNTSRAYTGYEEREPLAEGGQPTPRSNFAVGGPGDGRDDKIPAMLSDGEYVIDAETVALLGNGSNKAGAEALNKFRVNVRKHKGGKLAKGAFSVAAKRPEQYLKGRK